VEVFGAVVINTVLAAISPHHHRLATSGAKETIPKQGLDALTLFASAFAPFDNIFSCFPTQFLVNQRRNLEIYPFLLWLGP
jgi:hypothetical protein